LVFHSSTIAMMHGPINIRLPKVSLVYSYFVTKIKQNKVPEQFSSIKSEMEWTVSVCRGKCGVVSCGKCVRTFKAHLEGCQLLDVSTVL